MRVNIYAEEITDRVEIVEKHTDEGSFTGVRFYLELPVTLGTGQAQGPFMHRPGDDDSAAVTFWGKRELRRALIKALTLLDRHVPPMVATTETAGTDEQAAFGPMRHKVTIEATNPDHLRAVRDAAAKRLSELGYPA